MMTPQRQCGLAMTREEPIQSLFENMFRVNRPPEVEILP